MKEVADHVEDGAVEDGEATFDHLMTDCLNQMRFSSSGRTEKEHIAAFTEEATAGQIIDLLLVDGPVKRPFELVERLLVPEHGRLGAALDQTVAADEQFVLENEFEELGVRQLVTGGLL